ncbi:hypothetical protein DIPPA_33659 [Diplonema papillatum]|nr:hypothetical protein DIPPA_33659 [Diplonema papillatum]
MRRFSAGWGDASFLWRLSAVLLSWKTSSVTHPVVTRLASRTPKIAVTNSRRRIGVGGASLGSDQQDESAIMPAHYGETHYDYVPGVFRASCAEQWCQGLGSPADSPARDEGDHLEVRTSPEPQRQHSDLTDVFNHIHDQSYHIHGRTRSFFISKSVNATLSIT